MRHAPQGCLRLRTQSVWRLALAVTSDPGSLNAWVPFRAPPSRITKVVDERDPRRLGEDLGTLAPELDVYPRIHVRHVQLVVTRVEVDTP